MNTAMHKPYIFILAGLLLMPDLALGFELQVHAVTDHVYALVGETGPRTESNHGLNNTPGFIETDSGIVMVSSGTNAQAYDAIVKAIKTISDKPIKYVINIGTQDHHWIGNHYFIQQGASVVALKKTVDAQRANMDTQLSRLEQGIGEQIKSVHPVFASQAVDADRYTLSIDDTEMELIWPGKGHYAGDAILWLPDDGVMFTGDFVYMDRMLAIHPTSDVSEWQRSFHAIMEFEPRHIIPGHGKPADVAGARRDTGDYLDWLVVNVRAAVAEWKDINETIDDLADAPAFRHLKQYDSLHRRNIHQTYLQLEGE
jgi:glyoxylase-like metal-dependent hydrolase (beta-lactamase superfamily II)